MRRLWNYRGEKRRGWVRRRQSIRWEGNSAKRWEGKKPNDRKTDGTSGKLTSSRLRKKDCYQKS